MTNEERRVLQLRRFERALNLIALTLTRDVVRVGGDQHPAVHQVVEGLSELIRDQKAFIASGGVDMVRRSPPQ